MASTPPIDPRTAWRVQKEQQKAAERARREAWRTQKAYWKARRQPSMVGPLILIVIGVTALLVATGKIAAEQFWTWYGRWWPLLLVIMGVALLFEWFIDRRSAYPVRRGGGIVFLVLLIAAFGWAASTWRSWTPLHEFGEDDDDFFHFMGPEHDNDQQSSTAIPAGAHVQIQNSRGDVIIAAADGDGSMQIHAHQVVYTSSNDVAQRAFSSLTPKVTISGTSVLVHVDGNNNGKSDLSIELPRDASVDVSTNHGDVTVAGCRGSVNVNSGHGDVKLDDLSANVHTRMTKGDFSAHAVQGELALDGRMNDVTISDIRGKVLLEGDFFGDIHLEHLASPLHFHSSRTEIELGRIDGDLTMDSGDLQVSSAAGPVRVSTRSKDVDLSQIYGDVTVQNSNGSVKVASAAPLGQIQIDNRNGEVRVLVPPTASFSVDARATHGSIQTDFPLNVKEDEKSSSLSGQVGKGGPRIAVNTTNNDIQVQKGDTFPPLPPLPAVPQIHPAPLPPAPPVAPGTKGARHLTVPTGETPKTVEQ